MAGKRVLARLLRLREIEEEQSRLELEAAVAVRHRLERELASVEARRVAGRRSFLAGIANRDAVGRTGGVMEMEQATQMSRDLEPRLEAANREVIRQRAEFLARRTGRRQVETLLDRERGRQELDARHRAQQTLDDWFGRRSPVHAVRGEAAREGSEGRHK